MNIWNESSLEIEKLNLSNRTYNCLKLNGVNTIMELMLFSKEELINFTNLGCKSVEEISESINGFSKDNLTIKESENKYKFNKEVFKSPLDCLIIDCVTQDSSKVRNIMFYDNKGILRDDINIDQINLSKRLRHCLLKNRYKYVSQLLKLKKSELKNINNMGNKSIEELLNKIADIIHVIYENDDKNKVINYEVYCKQIIDEYNNCSISFNMKKVKANIYMLFKENRDFFEKHISLEKNIIEKFCNELDILDMFYSYKFFRKLIKSHIYNIISSANGSISLHSIRQSLPEHLKYSSVERDIISEMVDEKKLEWVDCNLRCCYPTLQEYINSIKNERKKNIVLDRLKGKTLEEIGNTLNITRERVRQIEKDILNKKPKLREDDYQEVFEKYDWDLETFTNIYSENELTFRYLKIIYKNGKNILTNFLEDKGISQTIRLKAEEIIYKDYIVVDSSRIKKERNEILDWILRTYCRNEVTYEEVSNLYYNFLKYFNLINNKGLIYPERYFERKLANSKKVLWKFGKKLRYYDFGNVDLSQIITELNLEQYKNVEYSTLKFFRDYSELMEEWDIRDEYELHNLIKKKNLDETGLDIKLLKMPNIEFGKADRDMQVLDLLIQNAPIENKDLAMLYEEEYGVKLETVLANYFKCIDEYYHNGVYSIDSEPLVGEQFDLIKNVLTQKFYFISDVKKIFIDMFSKGDVTFVNAYNLKRLGFKVNSNIIYSDKYINCKQYFKKLILKDDIFDASTLDKRMTCNPTYWCVVQALKEEYEIIEFSRNKFVNIRRLEEIRIGKGDLKQFCESVINFVSEEFFTIKSLRGLGFENKLDELGFEDYFYASILKCDNRFKYRRLGNNTLFRKGEKIVKLNSLIEYLVFNFKSIDIYDFIDFIFEEYGIKIDFYKIQNIIGELQMYYNPIMEKIYVDYDEYFKEV